MAGIFLAAYASLSCAKALSIPDLLAGLSLSPYSCNCFSVVKMSESAWLSFSTFSFSMRSLSALALASSRMRWISASVKPEEASIRIFCSLFVALSLADTFKIPLASTSKVTSIWGIPLGAGKIPSKWNWPMVRLSLAKSRSPCNTWITTDVWLSEAVENTSDFLVGIVVLASISFVNTPCNVSIPKDKGITSKRITSFTSPVKIPPWMAAPTATASSGFTPLDGFLPKNFSTSSWIFGIRVEPPTRITSVMSEMLKPESFMAWRQGVSVRYTRSSTSCSNFARERLRTKCWGTPSTAVI